MPWLITAAVLVLALAGSGAQATHQPADKVAAAGSTAQLMSPQAAGVTLLEEKVKTSSPTDLILGVTAECVITTEITTMGNDTESAEGTVRVWVEVDGVPVPVSSDDTTDTGKVTFCNQFEERQTTNFDDADATIRTLNRAGAANAFQWLRLNTGNGVHTITVRADFITTNTTPTSEAIAAVGKRTLIIEPVKAANDEAVTLLGD
jgi:hypothetical protein